MANRGETVKQWLTILGGSKITADGDYSHEIRYMLLYFIFLTFYFYFILLYNAVLVLPYIDMNPPRVYMRSQT